MMHEIATTTRTPDTAVIVNEPERFISLRDQPGDKNPLLVYLAGLAEGSRYVTVRRLEKAASILSSGTRTAQTLEWAQLRYEHVMALRAALVDSGAAPSTSNGILSCVRRVIEAAADLDLIPERDRRRVAKVPTVKGSRLPRGRCVPAVEIAKIFAVCKRDTGPSGVRDLGILAVAFGCGLRRSEICALELADYDADAKTITVQHGKGDKARVVPLAADVIRAVTAWLELRGDADGPLFYRTTQGKTGRIVAVGIGSQSLYGMLKRRCRRAGVQNVMPHDCRRTLVSDLLDSGADISTVARIAGHSSVLVTQKYDLRPERAKADAMELRHQLPV